MNIVAETLDVVGTVLIGMAALRVHHRVLYQHKIDRKVFRAMRVEQGLGMLGVFMIIIGFIWQYLSEFV